MSTHGHNVGWRRSPQVLRINCVFPNRVLEINKATAGFDYYSSGIVWANFADHTQPFRLPYSDILVPWFVENPVNVAYPFARCAFLVPRSYLAYYKTGAGSNDTLIYYLVNSAGVDIASAGANGPWFGIDPRTATFTRLDDAYKYKDVTGIRLEVSGEKVHVRYDLPEAWQILYIARTGDATPDFEDHSQATGYPDQYQGMSSVDPEWEWQPLPP